MRLLHSTITVFLTQLLSQAIAVIPSILVSRRFGDSGKGLITLMLYVPALLFSFSHLGLAGAAQYFIGRDEGPRPAHLTNALGLPFLTGLLTFALFSLTYSFWQPHLDNVPYAVLAPAMLILPLTLLISNCSQLLIAVGEVTKRNICYLLQGLSTAILVGLLVLLRAPLTDVLWGYIAGFALGGLLALYYCLKLYGMPALPTPSLLWRSLRYGFWIYVAEMLRSLFSRVGFFLLVGLSTIADGGVFSVALGVTVPLFNVPWAVQAVMLPRTAALSDADANRTTPIYFRQVTIVMFSVASVVALFSRPLLSLFGPEFLRGQAALLILLLGVIFGGQSALLLIHILGRGKSRITAVASAVSLVASVVAGLFLIPILGLEGAALATSGAHLLGLVVVILYFGRVARGNVAGLFHFRISDFAIFPEILHWLRQAARFGNNRGG